jgi:peptidoglycan/LPS O-acetylase OafA/YrhL
MNPYAPPDEESQPFQDVVNSKSQYRPGPVVPVAFGILAGVFSSASGFLQQRVPHAFLLMMPIGAIIGGIYFRLRCRNRPTDPVVKRHRLGTVVCILSSLLAISAFLTVAGEGDGYILGSALLTAVSMALGILFSGNRRLKPIS